MTRHACRCLAVLVLTSVSAQASGHGPVFGATTPTLGKGGWSVDEAWTLRSGDNEEREQMLKTMISFGITENLQISGSLPLAMGSSRLPGARMMSLMSNDRDVEGLVGYRFQHRVIGIGGRQESTLVSRGHCGDWRWSLSVEQLDSEGRRCAQKPSVMKQQSGFPAPGRSGSRSRGCLFLPFGCNKE